MEKIKFELNKGEHSENQLNYIELNKMLKILQIAQTGGHANLLITSGEIIVNDEVEYRKRKKLRKGDHVIAMDAEIEIV
jgi:ribosome-associated protein